MRARNGALLASAAGGDRLRWVEEARRRELERALRLLRSGRDPGSVSEALAHRLTNKVLHAPTRALRDQGG